MTTDLWTDCIIYDSVQSSEARTMGGGRDVDLQTGRRLQVTHQPTRLSPSELKSGDKWILTYIYNLVPTGLNDVTTDAPVRDVEAQAGDRLHFAHQPARLSSPTKSTYTKLGRKKT